jgi:hypothetical protein
MVAESGPDMRIRAMTSGFTVLVEGGGAAQTRPRSRLGRSEGEIRRVPCPPPLTRLLREYLAVFAGEPADLCLRPRRSRPPPSSVHCLALRIPAQYSPTPCNT